MAKNKVHIGCSGWNYDHWKRVFYKKSSSSGEWFSEYSSVFSTVEINNTFYRLPEESTFRKWHDQAAKGFIYAVKANRFITHMKKLKDPKEPVELFLGRARLLGEHLGPILFQIPPHWSVNPKRLDEFTGILPAGLKYVFEFRDSSWYDDEVYGILSGKKMSVCRHDMEGSASPDVSVGPLCYIRFHGTSGTYGGRYPDKVLKKWSDIIRKELDGKKEVYVYFNNDAEANAPKDAQRLWKILEK